MNKWIWDNIWNVEFFVNLINWKIFSLCCLTVFCQVGLHLVTHVEFIIIYWYSIASISFVYLCCTQQQRKKVMRKTLVKPTLCQPLLFIHILPIWFEIFKQISLCLNGGKKSILEVTRRLWLFKKCALSIFSFNIYLSKISSLRDKLEYWILRTIINIYFKFSFIFFVRRRT